MDNMKGNNANSNSKNILEVDGNGVEQEGATDYFKVDNQILI